METSKIELYKKLGTSNSDNQALSILKCTKDNYVKWVEELENEKYFSTGMIKRRNNYRTQNKDVHLRHSEMDENDDKLNRLLIHNPIKNDKIGIKLEHAIQRNIFYNYKEFEDIIGIPIFYEFPLFHSDGSGGIDLVCFKKNDIKNQLLLVELKKCKSENLIDLTREKGKYKDYFSDSTESFIRAHSEISTYYTLFKELYDELDEVFINELKVMFNDSGIDENLVYDLEIKKAILAPHSFYKNNYMTNYINDCLYFTISANKEKVLSDSKVKDNNLFIIGIYENSNSTN